jgi:hypothetical protein
MECDRTVEHVGFYDNDVKVGKSLHIETITYIYLNEYWDITTTYEGDYA